VSGVWFLPLRSSDDWRSLLCFARGSFGLKTQGKLRYFEDRWDESRSQDRFDDAELFCVIAQLFFGPSGSSHHQNFGGGNTSFEDSILIRPRWYGKGVSCGSKGSGGRISAANFQSKGLFKPFTCEKLQVPLPGAIGASITEDAIVEIVPLCAFQQQPPLRPRLTLPACVSFLFSTRSTTSGLGPSPCRGVEWPREKMEEFNRTYGSQANFGCPGSGPVFELAMMLRDAVKQAPDCPTESFLSAATGPFSLGETRSDSVLM